MFPGLAIGTVWRHAHELHNADMLPTHVQKFHLWQNDLHGLYDALQHEEEQDRKLQDEFFMHQLLAMEEKRLMKERKSESIRDWLQDQLEDFEERAERIFYMRTIQDMNEDYLAELQQAIDHEIYRLDVSDPVEAQMQDELFSIREGVKNIQHNVEEELKAIKQLLRVKHPITEEQVIALENRAVDHEKNILDKAQDFFSKIKEFLKEHKNMRSAVIAAQAIDKDFMDKSDNTRRAAFYYLARKESKEIDEDYPYRAANDDAEALTKREAYNKVAGETELDASDQTKKTAEQKAAVNDTDLSADKRSIGTENSRTPITYDALLAQTETQNPESEAVIERSEESLYQHRTRILTPETDDNADVIHPNSLYETDADPEEQNSSIKRLDVV